MTFFNPSAFILLLLLLMMGNLLYWRSLRRRKLIAQLGDQRLISSLANETGYRQTWYRIAIWFLSMIAIIFAIARPAWGIGEEVIEAEGIALLVVLDVSASMDARDVYPSRLERAKLDALRLFNNDYVAEMGLILFAGEAYVQFPLTRDTRAAQVFLSAASSNSITRQGTAIEAALRLALETFDERLVARSVMVLMSDGENHEGDPILAAEDASFQGITIYSIGYGTPEGSSIPEEDGSGTITGYKTDRAGNVVISVLDEQVLQEVADVTMGLYRRSTDTGIEIVDILNEFAQMRAAEMEERLEVRPIERFSLFVFIATAFLLVEILWPGIKRVRV